MSTTAYGALSRKRKQSPSGKSKGENNWPPALKPWVDTLTALVPAEALVAHTYVMDGYRDGMLGMPLIKVAFYVLPIGCVVAYFIGERSNHGFGGALEGLDGWDIVRGVVVPVGAYFGWMLAQNESLLALHCPLPLVCPVTEAKQYLLVPVMALILGFLAGWPGANKADQKTGIFGESASDATEAARRKAEELGVDLSQVDGSGDGGRILVEDVEKTHRMLSSEG